MSNTNYTRQATDFLKSTDSVLKIEYLRYWTYFPWEKEKRYVYICTLQKKWKPFIFSFTFWDSIHNTETRKWKPLAYDVLSSLSVYWYDYEDFLSEFWYQDNGISKQIFYDVENQEEQLKILYTEKEIEMLNDIN